MERRYCKLLKSLKENLQQLNETSDEAEVKAKANKLKAKIKSSSKSQKYSSCLFYVLTIGMLILGIAILNWDNLRIHFIFLIRIIFLIANRFFNISFELHNNCLILNPLHHSQHSYDSSFCKLACSDKEIPKVFETTTKSAEVDELVAERSEYFYKKVYESNIPVLFKHEMLEWPIANLTIPEIINIYSNAFSNNQIEDENICMYDSEESIDFLLKNSIQKSAAKPFTLMWENCNKKSSKLIRKLIQRPTFLSKSIELLHTNWVYLSQNDKKSFYRNHFMKLALAMRITMLCQIKGSLSIMLVPTKECKNDCVSKRITLNPGGILVLTDMWQVKFRRANDDDEIFALALFAH